MSQLEQMFVKSADPAKPVRKPTPRREFLADDGESVPRDSYWLRRLKDGDVVLATPPKAAAPAASAPKSK